MTSSGARRPRCARRGQRRRRGAALAAGGGGGATTQLSMACPSCAATECTVQTVARPARGTSYASSETVEIDFYTCLKCQRRWKSVEDDD